MTICRVVSPSFVAILAPLACLLIICGCQKGPTIPAPLTISLKDSADNNVVGSHVCAECHKAEFDIQSHSRHARTMRPAHVSQLAVQSPRPGPISGSAYSIAQTGDNLRFERVDDPSIGGDMKYALGSGKDVFTFVGRFTATGLTEYRKSYIPAQHRWVATPGQERFVNLEPGYVHELGQARSCMSCHSMKNMPGTTEPDPTFLGVGCESCHGGGAAHVAAVKAGASDLKMKSLKGRSGAEINAVCGMCHRSLDDVTLETEDSSYTARFQGYATEMSACFQKSKGKFTCVTCHNPHEDVKTDNRYYEKICRNCHDGGVDKPACRINPTNGCIPCHMPRRRIVANRDVPITMADHMITKHSGP